MEKPINSSKQSDTGDQSSNLSCWKKDERAQCLRVECGLGEQFLFPYGYFHEARFVASDDEETIELLFSSGSRSVRIKGHNLEDVWLALQNLSVAWIRPLPRRFAPLAKGQTSIKSVSVEDAQKAKTEVER
jgi:hypothetical protein